MDKTESVKVSKKTKKLLDKIKRQTKIPIVNIIDKIAGRWQVLENDLDENLVKFWLSQNWGYAIDIERTDYHSYSKDELRNGYKDFLSDMDTRDWEDFYKWLQKQ